MLLPKGFLLMMACIAGCKEAPPTKESLLREHVAACGAGFSDSLQSSLADSLLIHSLKNTFEAGFKVQAKELIFEELPPEDRLRAYEDYLRCIQKEPDFPSHSMGTP